MSFKRYANRVDTAQKPIVDGLRDVPGIQVWVIREPCDLLTLFRNRWLPLEVKSDTSCARTRKDQGKQKEFLAATGVPVVKTVQEAIEAITKHGACHGKA